MQLRKKNKNGASEYNEDDERKWSKKRRILVRDMADYETKVSIPCFRLVDFAHNKLRGQHQLVLIRLMYC